MFTGLILERGKVKRIEELQGRRRIHFLFLGSRRTKADLGESITVNGVCLTAAAVLHGRFAAEILEETWRATALGTLSAGDCVHLERALKYGDPLGGHFVTGHVDTRCQIQRIEKFAGQRIFWIKAPRRFFCGIALKGSVALDGVSLTVQEVRRTSFKIAMVPHTLQKTNFESKKEGDWLNLEMDMLARYSERKASQQESLRDRNSRIRRLREQGF